MGRTVRRGCDIEGVHRVGCSSREDAFGVLVGWSDSGCDWLRALRLIRRPVHPSTERAPAGRTERDLIGAWQFPRRCLVRPSRPVVPTPSALTNRKATSSMHEQHHQVTGGVDTHGEVHVAAVIDATGRILGTESFPATLAGYRSLCRCLRPVPGRSGERPGRGHQARPAHPGPPPSGAWPRDHRAQQPDHQTVRGGQPCAARRLGSRA